MTKKQALNAVGRRVKIRCSASALDGVIGTVEGADYDRNGLICVRIFSITPPVDGHRFFCPNELILLKKKEKSIRLTRSILIEKWDAFCVAQGGHYWQSAKSGHQTSPARALLKALGLDEP